MREHTHKASMKSIPTWETVDDWIREEIQLLSQRYERGTIMITSNLPFSKWEQIFKDQMTTAAAIDRLGHHCVILELNLPSYRLEHSKIARKGKVKAAQNP